MHLGIVRVNKIATIEQHKNRRHSLLLVEAQIAKVPQLVAIRVDAKRLYAHLTRLILLCKYASYI